MLSLKPNRRILGMSPGLVLLAVGAVIVVYAATRSAPGGAITPTVAAMQRRGMTVIWPAANAGRPVGVYVPPSTQRNAPVEFILHFHGSDSHLIEEPIPYDDTHYKRGDITVGANRLDQALAAAAKRNSVLIYPLSAGRRPPGGWAYTAGYDEHWMQQPENATELVRAVEQLLGLRAHSLTVTGHSAGGYAIANAVENGLKPTRIKFLDASYGTNGARAAAAAPDTPIEFHVVPGTKTEDSARLARGPNVRVIPRSGLSHGNFVSLL